MDYWWKEEADSLRAADGTDLEGSELEDYRQYLCGTSV